MNRKTRLETAQLATTALLSLLAAAGCSIPYGAAETAELNSCDAEQACSAGATCSPVGDQSICVSNAVDLTNLVIEVRPALGSKGASTVSLLLPGSFSSASNLQQAQLIDLDLRLPAYVDVAPGRVYLPCAGGTPVPARVTFRPIPGFTGPEGFVSLHGLLEGQTYESDSVLDESGNEAFEASVPPGVYDLYLQPEPDLATTPDCVSVSPIFLPRQTISKDVGFVVNASAPLLLTGTLKLSEKEDFTQWFLEVIEPYTGKTISDVVQPEQVGIALEVPFEVRFDWTASSDYTPIIRLRPPEKSGKPVIHWRLDAVALQGVDANKNVPVKLDVSSIDTLTRPASGQVFQDISPAAATVTLRSTSISGDEMTRYETVVETDMDGYFTTALPPGEYQVIARPHDKSLGLGVTTWKIAKDEDCFCGNSVQVPLATTLAGTVATPDGNPASVEVRLTPAATGALSYLSTILTPEVQPRQASTPTREGEFQLNVDPGFFDLSIIATPGSGYPWLVRPRLFVSPAETTAAPVISLLPIQLQSPVVLRGLVFDPSGVRLPGATVRAWLPVGPAMAGNLAQSAVQIAEAVADQDGSYVLLLPPSIGEGQ